MKYIKFFVLLTVLFLVGCTEADITDITDSIAIQYSETDHKDSVSNDLQIPVKIDGIDISWSSDSEFAKIEGNKIVITRQATDTLVTITASYKVGKETLTKSFPITLAKLPVVEPTFDLDAFKTFLSMPLETEENLSLKSSYLDLDVVWSSSNASVISNTGVITRQADDTVVTLTASILFGGKTYEATFEINVIKAEVVTPDYDAILDTIVIPSETINNLVLPTSLSGVNLVWSSNHAAISSTGVVTRQSENVIVELTVTVVDHLSFSKKFNVTVLKKVDFPVSSHTPISEARLQAQGSSVKVQGVITSLMSNGNFTIQDSTGAIPVYMRNNTGLVIGKEYVIEGKIDIYQGLVQIGSPTIVETLSDRSLPEGIDLTGYSLVFDDVILYEANIVTYHDLEVTSKETPNNAIELYLKNAAGETTFVRLDTRVNNPSNQFDQIKVGDIVNLFNVTVGQYAGKAQFLFTSRSLIEARPKNPEIISIYGAVNKNYIMGDALPNYLEGITAKNGFGEDFTQYLVVDTSAVKLNEPGNYDIKVSLSNDSSVSAIYTLFVRKEIEQGVYEGYYSRLNGLMGANLNQELKSLIVSTGRATGSTSEVKSVDKVGSQYYLIYEGLGSYGNREHVWPQSKLGSTKDDLHNLRAAVESTNSARGNMPFGEDGKAFTGTQPYKNNGGSWYPGDKHIGDVARIVLYISIRYNLSLNVVGNLQMFLEWHDLDPVDDFEIERNDRIYGIQNNRNPFIDHPELVDLYFGGAANKSLSRTLSLINISLFMAMDNRQYIF